VRQQQAAIYRRHRDRQRLLALGEGVPTVDGFWLELAAPEQIQQGFAAPGGFRVQQHAATDAEIAQHRDGVIGLGIDRQRRRGFAAEYGAARADIERCLADHHLLVSLEAGEQLLDRLENTRRRQDRPLDIVAALFVAIAGLVPEALRSGL